MKKILVVVDYQKDFVDGALGFKEAENLEEGILAKVNEYLDKGEKVIFTYDTHDERYLESREGKNLPVKHCIKGTEGHELYGKLKNFKNYKGTIHICKESFGISPKGILEIAKEVGDDVDIIEIVGVVTDICVISNVVTLQSYYINSDIHLNKNLCASFDKNMHEKAIEVMKSLQVKII